MTAYTLLGATSTDGEAADALLWMPLGTLNNAPRLSTLPLPQGCRWLAPRGPQAGPPAGGGGGRP